MEQPRVIWQLLYSGMCNFVKEKSVELSPSSSILTIFIRSFALRRPVITTRDAAKVVVKARLDQTGDL